MTVSLFLRCADIGYYQKMYWILRDFLNKTTRKDLWQWLQFGYLKIVIKIWLGQDILQVIYKIAGGPWWTNYGL